MSRPISVQEARAIDRDAVEQLGMPSILLMENASRAVADAARELGVSRKTYYKWEQRALEAMMKALFERNSGRPVSAIDEEKEAMRQKIGELEKQLRLTPERIQIAKEAGQHFRVVDALAVAVPRLETEKALIEKISKPRRWHRQVGIGQVRQFNHAAEIHVPRAEPIR